MNEAVQAILGFLLEDDEVRRERAKYVARMRDKMKLPFRRIGSQLNVSKQRAHQLYRLHQRLAQPVAEADEDDFEMDPKEMNSMAPPERAMQEVTDFFNKQGAGGEFKVWPKGTYKGPYPEYAENAEFSVTLSGVLAEFWEEHFRMSEEFDLLMKSLGWHYEMGSRSSLHFYWDPILAFNPEPKPPARDWGGPAPNLRDIQI